MGIKMDEEGVGSCLLPLQCQVQQASAEWGQGPSEAGGGEELKQVWPQNLGGEGSGVGASQHTRHTGM